MWTNQDLTVAAISLAPVVFFLIIAPFIKPKAQDALDSSK